MIAVQLQGGLGNQLFEYATAKALAAKIGQRPYLDTSLLETKNAHRPFFIKAFPLQATYPSNRLQRWYFHRFQKPYLVDIDESEAPSHEEIVDQVYLKGYWQNPAFFRDIKAELLQEIDIPLNAIQALGDEDDGLRVGVHVRRGDFIGHPQHEVCNSEYYLRAIEEMRKRLPGCRFYIFSDDIHYCKSIFSHQPDLKYVEENDSVRSFLLLKKCAHFVLSNSSFGWWAQYLKEKPSQVIAPMHWLKNKPTQEMPLFQPHWQLM